MATTRGAVFATATLAGASTGVATIGVDFAFSNLGVRAFTTRLVGGAWGGPIAIVLFVLAIAASLRRGDRFSRLVVVMTMFGPLVWYHHLVCFVLPIVLHMKTRPLLVWSAVALVQIERPLCDRYAVLTAVMTPLMRRQYREAFKRQGEAQAHMVESVTGVATVKAMAAERRTRWKLEGLMVKALNVQFRGAMLNVGLFSAAGVLQKMTSASSVAAQSSMR